MVEFSSGDIRTAARGAWLFERIVETGSVVLRDLGGDRAGEVAAHRFLSSPYVSTEGLLAAVSARAGAAAAGRRVVAAQDTTEINFSGRDGRRRGLGRSADGKSVGFFIHPVVVVDADEEAVLGLAGAQIWTRGAAAVGDRHRRAGSDKESRRWLEGMLAAAEALTGAAQVIVVADREGDVWAHFAGRPRGVDMAVRARHDRSLGEGPSLFEVLAKREILAVSEVRMGPRRPGDEGRLAKTWLRAGRVAIRRPDHAPPGDPERLELGLVEVVEPDPPDGVKPLLWRILTSLPVETAEDAKEVVRLYRLRWRVEEVFRALKREGLGLEDTQVQDKERLFRLAVLALGAAVRIIQLVDARDGGPRPMSDVLDDDLQSAVALMVRSREGATERQKNPHPAGSLAWLSWVVARYGGWNSYYKPPGPKTMARGWERFSATLTGIILAKDEALP
ncbi:MAG: IS4 family transposase [Caulobacteraceae bacterium]